MFNIGVEGQFILGAFGATVVGDRPQGPAAAGRSWSPRRWAGVLTGAFWGFIPGVLKAKTGAHEVITTIMLNYVAAQIVLFGLRSDFLRQEGSSAADLQGHRRLGPHAADHRPARRSGSTTASCSR